MHAYELPVYGFPDGALIATAEVATRVMSGAEAGLDALVEPYRDGLHIDTVLRQGVVWEEVRSVAEEISADMIHRWHPRAARDRPRPARQRGRENHPHLDAAGPDDSRRWQRQEPQGEQRSEHVQRPRVVEHARVARAEVAALGFARLLEDAR